MVIGGIGACVNSVSLALSADIHVGTEDVGVKHMEAFRLVYGLLTLDYMHALCQVYKLLIPLGFNISSDWQCKETLNTVARASK